MRFMDKAIADNNKRFERNEKLLASLKPGCVLRLKTRWVLIGSMRKELRLHKNNTVVYLNHEYGLLDIPGLLSIRLLCQQQQWEAYLSTKSSDLNEMLEVL